MYDLGLYYHYYYYYYYIIIIILLLLFDGLFDKTQNFLQHNLFYKLTIKINIIYRYIRGF